jgi:hypothetical protein
MHNQQVPPGDTRGTPVGWQQCHNAVDCYVIFVKIYAKLMSNKQLTDATAARQIHLIICTNAHAHAHMFHPYMDMHTSC